MTREKAVEYLEKLKAIEQGKPLSSGKQLYVEALCMAIKALKKQIPDKPELLAYGYFDGELMVEDWVCPDCETEYEIDDKHKFCPECGQAIDWKEVD